jgi:hypothetical protein
MPSFACLRVELPDAWSNRFDAIRDQLAKIVEAYLEARWSWPRRFSRVADLVFLLEDPRVSQLVAAELCKLAQQLQQHLFGAGGDGEVTLLLFEGSPQAVAAFAAYSAEAVAGAIAEPGRLPVGARLMRIHPAAEPVVEELGVGAEPAAETEDAPANPVHPTQRYRPGLLGTYLLSREVFIADVLALAQAESSHCFSVIEDLGSMPPNEALFDEVCFRHVGEVLARKEGGLPLGVPISFSHFVRPALAERLPELLALLPKDRRDQLNASIYGVPRHLPVGVANLRPLLQPYFSTINLITTDPGFEIEQIASHSVGSVIFCVQEHEPHARQAAMRAFAAHHEVYRCHNVHPVLANLRTRAELELAARLDLQIVSGPAVCGLLEAPIGGRRVPLAKLPVRAG